MKLFLYHLIVLIYYVNFDMRLQEICVQIFRDIKILNDNKIIMLTGLCTMWNAVLQQIYFVLSTFEDILRLTSKFRNVRRHSDMQRRNATLFTRYVFPLSIVVCVNFWVFYSINSRILDEYDIIKTYATSWENHRIHTVVVLLSVVELFVKRIPYPRRLWPDIITPGLVVIFYLTVAGIFQTQATTWVYPLFHLCRWYHMLLVAALTLVLSSFAYVTGKMISDTVLGNKTKSIR